jgi:hypothetical protein
MLQLRSNTTHRSPTCPGKPLPPALLRLRFLRADASSERLQIPLRRIQRRY